MRSPTPSPRPARPLGWLGAFGRAAVGLATIACTLGQGQTTPPTSAPGAVQASAQADNVAIITIRGEIDEYTAQSVRRRMEIAQKGGAQAVVFELDTPGGNGMAMLDICDMIKQSPISNTVAWVHTKAYSAGAVIALACKEIVTSDSATLGDAMGITGANGFGWLGELPEAERQKFSGPAIAEVVDSARRRGYDEKLVQGMISRGVELWLVADRSDPSRRLFIGPEEYRLLFGTEPDRSLVPTVVAAVPQGGTPDAILPTDTGTTSPPRADTGRPPDPTDFIPASPVLSGKELSGDINIRMERASTRPVLTEADQGHWTLIEYVSTGSGLILLKAPELQRYGLSRAAVSSDQDLTAYFGAKNLRRLDPTWSEAFTVFLTNWPVRAVLIVVFLIGLFLEMAHPGLVLPGTIAGAALIALLAPPLVVGMASWWEIAAVLVGILLIALEIFVIPGFGLAGVVGLVLLFGGLIGTFVRESPGSLFPNTAEGRSDLLFGVVSIMMALGTSSIAIYYLGKHFGSLPILGRLVLKEPGTTDDDSDALFSAMSTEAPPSVAEGDIGVAATPIRPIGRAHFDDRVIDVVSEMAYIRAGERVRVVSAGALRIVVEPAGPDDAPPSDGDRAA